MPKNNLAHWQRRLLMITSNALLLLSISCAAPQQVTYIVGVTAIQDGTETMLKNQTYTLENVVLRLSTGDEIKAEKILFHGQTGDFESDGIQGRIHASQIALLMTKGRKYNMKAENGAKGNKTNMTMHNAFVSTGKTDITARKIYIKWK